MAKYHIASTGKQAGMMVVCPAKVKCTLTTADGQPAHHGNFVYAKDANNWNRIQTAVNLGSKEPLPESKATQDKLEHMTSLPESEIQKVVENETRNQLGVNAVKGGMTKKSKTRTKFIATYQGKKLTASDIAELPSDIQNRMAARSNASSKVLDALSHSPDEEVVKRVIANPNVSSDTLRAIYHNDKNGKYENRKVAVSYNPFMSTRESLALAPDLPDDVVSDMANDKDGRYDEYLVERGTSRIIHKGDSIYRGEPLDTQYLDKIANRIKPDSNPVIAKGLSLNPNASTEAIAKAYKANPAFAKDMNINKLPDSMRGQAARNKFKYELAEYSSYDPNSDTPFTVHGEVLNESNASDMPFTDVESALRTTGNGHVLSRMSNTLAYRNPDNYSPEENAIAFRTAKAIAANENATTTQLERLSTMDTKDHEIAKVIAGNYQTGRSRLERYAKSSDTELRDTARKTLDSYDMHWAQSPKAEPQRLATLGTTGNHFVKLAVTKNPNTSDDLLKIMTKDSDSDVSEAANKALDSRRA